MNINQLIATVNKMFPSVNLGGAIQKAQEATQGTPDTLTGVSSAARKIGIDQNVVNTIFQKYGNTMQAKMLCSMMGTTPEALKKDADRIVGGGSENTFQQFSKNKFPRLK